MLNFLAAIDPPTFWNFQYGGAEVYSKLIIGLVIGLVFLGFCMVAPAQLRRPIVTAVTFLSGLFYIMLLFWPEPVGRKSGDIPQDSVEQVSFFLKDALPRIGDISNILGAFLIGLGVYSLFRVHVTRVVKQQKDWSFSLVLLGSMVTIAVFGYIDYFAKQGDGAILLQDPNNWKFGNYGRDLLFDGMLQEMESAMFSIIAFYILSAAYRAFRLRSIEASILLGSAFIVMLSLMSGVEYLSTKAIAGMASDKDAFINNFTLTSVAGWIRGTIQTSSIRGIDFGVGIGLLAMGLRIWLSLERTGD